MAEKKIIVCDVCGKEAGTPVLTINLPTCQFCSEKACYDAKTIYFSWAYMCGYHYLVYGIKSTGIKLKKVREQK